MIDEKKLDKEIADWFKKAISNGNHEVDTVDTSAVVRHIIDKQPKVDVPDTNVGEWIPCSEPPKYTGDYLVTVGINRDGLGMYDEVRTANYNTFYETWTVHEDWKNAIGTNPIAWMSLPPAYKEDKE